MKDLELKDILNKERIPFTKLSVYINGRWEFATLSNPIITKDDQSYYRMVYRFGLTKDSVNDPAKFSQLGEPGDYVAMDSTGELSLVKKQQYNQIFPQQNIKPKKMLDSSAKLSDPNYITKIVRGS